MALPNDISKIGQIANAVYNSVTANNTAVTALSISNNSVYPSTSGFRRNRIINGAMQIDQRNAGGSQTVTTGGAYVVDRWFVQPTGASVTAQRVAGPSGYQYTSQITGAASVTGIILFQKIEAANTADLVNQNVTLSVIISNSLLTTVNWTVNSANAIDNFSAVTVIASGSFTVTSTATQYTATFNAGANAANGISIVFSVGAQTSGTLKITGAQLEPGDVATPFERLPIGETLILCQRYYEKSYAQSVVPGTISQLGRFTIGNGAVTGSTQNYNVRFQVLKRTNASVVVYSAYNGVVGKVTQSDGATDVSITALQSSDYAFDGYVTNSAGLYNAIFHFTASAEL